MDVSRGNTGNILRTLTFLQLQEATKNFRPDMYIGEGGSAHVFKGKLPTGQDVAVKQLKPVSDRNTDYEVEVRTLSRLSHPNIINLIGFCAEGDERIIVYEFMPLGSLYDHLHGNMISVPSYKLSYIVFCLKHSLSIINDLLMSTSYLFTRRY